MAKNKFEQLIEFIINENEAEAKKVFHQIVVDQSRKIYEDLQDEELGAEGMADELEGEHDVIDGDEEGGEDEFGADGGDEFGDEEGIEGDEFGGEDLGDDGSVEDRVMNLEDALDELKAQFDALVDGEEGEGQDLEGLDGIEGDDEFGGEGEEDFGGEDDFDAEEVGADTGEIDDEDLGDNEQGFGEASIYGSQKSAGETMREYVEKVTKPNVDTEGSEIGSGGKSVSVNKKSTQISGKNDMGGTTANIAQGKFASDRDSNTGPKKPSNAYAKGQKDIEGASSWENRPGAGTKGYKDKQSGKTKEGATTDGSVAVAKKSFNPGGTPGFKG